MEVDRGKELSHNLRVKVQVEHDQIINAKLLHQVQSLTKIYPVIILPHMIHVNTVL